MKISFLTNRSDGILVPFGSLQSLGTGMVSDEHLTNSSNGGCPLTPVFEQRAVGDLTYSISLIR
jgi:hypothetical protein